MIDGDEIRGRARLTYERFRCRIPHGCVQRSHAPAEKLIPIGFVSLSIRVSSLAPSAPAGTWLERASVGGRIRQLLLFNVKAPFASLARSPLLRQAGRQGGRQTPPTHSPASLSSSCLSIVEAPSSCFKDTACRRPSSHPHPPPLLSSRASQRQWKGLVQLLRVAMKVSRSAGRTPRPGTR